MTAEKKWYEKDLRRILVDMHIPDWDERFLKDFSAEKYADMMKKAGITCAELYAGNCLGLCLFPTEKGYVHKQLHGRDIFGETLEACKKRGLDVQIYFNVFHRSAFEAHPDWRIINSKGQNTRELKLFRSGRFGICCINSPFGDFFLDIIRELDSRYEGVGFWIDMLAWWGILCHCDSCKKRFKKDCGKDIPEMIDWNDPVFNEYIRWRASVLAEFAHKITNTVKKQHPERSVTIQAACAGSGTAQSGFSKDFLSASDFLAGDFSWDYIEQSLICKLFSALSRNRPMEFMTPRCESLDHHTTPRIFENVLSRAYAALSNQSSFTLIDAIDPRGTLDERFYEIAGKVNAEYKKYEKYVSGKSVPVTDLAVYYEFMAINADLPSPLESHLLSANDSIQPVLRRNLVPCFMRNRQLFTFTGEFEEDFSRYPCIILSDAARLSSKECEKIRKYVAEGGCLYASGNSSLYDPENGMREDFLLADVFGVHHKGKTPPCTYIAPTENSFLKEYTTKDYPVMLNSPQNIVEADPDCLVLGTLVLPVSHPSEETFFGSAISNPPMVENNTPALTLHKYGKGKVIYCAGRLEEVPFDYQRNIFCRILKELDPRTLIRCDIHEKVEFTLFDEKEEKHLILSLLNQIAFPAVTIDKEIRIKVALPHHYKVEKVLLAPEETPLPWLWEKDILTITLPSLELFAMLLIKYTAK